MIIALGKFTRIFQNLATSEKSVTLTFLLRKEPDISVTCPGKKRNFELGGEMPQSRYELQYFYHCTIVPCVKLAGMVNSQFYSINN